MRRGKQTHVNLVNIGIFQGIKYRFLAYSINDRFHFTVKSLTPELRNKSYQHAIVFLNPFEMRTEGCVKAEIIQRSWT
ncbi:hypothetical protein D3C73_1617870 [compost metagenome]